MSTRPKVTNSYVKKYYAGSDHHILYDQFHRTIGDLRGLGLALGTVKRFKERIARLYEQGADEHRIGQYVRRFKGWAKCPGPFAA